MNEIKIDSYDNWLKNDGPAALTFHRKLTPVEGKDAWIFPPTFAQTESADEEEEGAGGDYQIDNFPEGDSNRNVCLIDSIGSQANRMEPLFKREPYSGLVPKRVVTVANGDTVNILDVGHRAADAAIRFSEELGPKIWEAFHLIKTKRDYSKLAALAPTSLVFGVWDSRGTGVKVQRILKSTIRAYNVIKAKRSATYQAAYEYVENGLIAPEFDKGSGKSNPLSQEGFKYSLATGTHGGVQVRGETRQEAMINLAALRTLTDDLNLKRYLLGLALVALSFRDQTTFNLREGCLLRAATAKDFEGLWNSVDFNGTETPIELTHDQAIAYTRLAVANVSFEAVGTAEFDKNTVEAWLQIDRKRRKVLAKRSHPVNAVAEEAAKASQSGDPHKKLRQLVEGLKMNKAGSKLNEAPVKKLKEHLESIQEGDDLKEQARQMVAALEGDDDPASKIQKLKDLLPPADDTVSSDKSNEGGGDTEEVSK